MQAPDVHAMVQFSDVLQHAAAEYAHAYADAGCPRGRSVEALAVWLEDADGEWVDADALEHLLEREGLADHGRLV